jgi:hypothetical protein
MTGTIAENLANNLPIGLAFLALALYVFYAACRVLKYISTPQMMAVQLGLF